MATRRVSFLLHGRIDEIERALSRTLGIPIDQIPAEVRLMLYEFRVDVVIDTDAWTYEIKGIEEV